MKLPFVVTMALRESRRSRRRLALYLSAVSLGVAAVVAINSFGADVTTSIQAQARALLGADIELTGRAAFPPAVETILDSAGRAGVRVARVRGTRSTGRS
jgi:putative ABC transport system permease protein